MCDFADNVQRLDTDCYITTFTAFKYITCQNPGAKPSVYYFSSKIYLGHILPFQKIIEKFRQKAGENKATDFKICFYLKEKTTCKQKTERNCQEPISRYL